MPAKDELLIKLERREKQRRKQMMHETFVSCVGMISVWKKMCVLDPEQLANNVCNEGSLGSTSASERDLKWTYRQTVSQQKLLSCS